MKLRNSIRPIRLLLLLSGLLALASCRQDETQSLSEYLDYVIENKHIFEAEKEERISRLRNLLGVSNLTPEQEYEINTKLYEEFRKYKPDTPLHPIVRTPARPASRLLRGQQPLFPALRHAEQPAQPPARNEYLPGLADDGFRPGIVPVQDTPELQTYGKR